MATILDHYQFTQLATAAYINLDGKATDGVTVADAAAAQSRLPTAIAEKLFRASETNPNVWTIPTRPLPEGATASGYYGNDGTGFAATLFEKDGKKVLAIRGTEPDVNLRLDLAYADIGQIGYLGFALSQTIAMINYILRLTSGPDILVRQYDWVLSPTRPDPATAPSIPVSGGLLHLYLADKAAMPGLGLIAPGEQIVVTGHSLGGHLAALAARPFPALVDAAYTYNAPGFDPATAFEASLVAYVGALAATQPAAAAAIVVGGAIQGTVANRLTEPFVTLMESYLPAPPAGTFGALPLYNLESEDSAPGDDASLVAGWFTGATIYGAKITVTTEGNSHLIEPLTDNLAVHALLYRMNAAMTISDTGHLLEAASTRREDTDETIVGALHRLLVPDGKAPSPLPETYLEDNLLGPLVGRGAIAKRQDFYTAVLEIENTLKADPGLALLPLAGLTAADLATAAANPDGVATRYALKELNPFALVDADYGCFNANGELDLYDPGSGAGTLSAEWIADCAGMLAAVLARNVANRTDPRIDGDTAYKDLARGLALGPNALPQVGIIFGGDAGNGFRFTRAKGLPLFVNSVAWMSGGAGRTTGNDERWRAVA